MNADGHHHCPRDFLIKLYKGREMGILSLLYRCENSGIKKPEVLSQDQIANQRKNGY